MPDAPLQNSGELIADGDIWADDAQLRALAQESEDGITNWILASDMREFYAGFDRFNATRDEASKVRLRLSKSASDQIQEYRQKGFHKTSELPQTTGPLILQGETLLRYMGPQSIGEDHMVFEAYGEFARAFYHADPFNTNMNIEMGDGSWAKIEFGMGNPLDQFFPVAQEALPAHRLELK